MRRQLLGLVVIVAATMSVGSGCSSCLSPYDYCGPVFAGGECSTCLVHERVGSVIDDPGFGPWGELSPAPSGAASRDSSIEEDEGPEFEDLPTPGEGEDIPFPGSAPREMAEPISTFGHHPGLRLRR